MACEIAMWSTSQKGRFPLSTTISSQTNANGNIGAKENDLYK